MICDTDKDKVVDCTTPMTYEEYKRMTNEYCRNVAHREHEQTNEEWFCSQSTEKKAEFLVMIQMSVMHPVKRGAVDMEKFIEEVVEWLKQPHIKE